MVIDRLWPDSTIVCMAPGPSLLIEDANYVRGKAPVIVINDAVQLAPWANVLYSSDQYWFPGEQGVPSFTGLKFAIAPRVGSMSHSFGKYPEISVLANTGDEGIEVEPTGLRTGKNSGYAAINLALHLGATRVLLLGYDMGRGPRGEGHFHGRGGISSPYSMFLKMFAGLPYALKTVGLSVINCSRQTALTMFPRMTIEEALS